MLGLPMEWPEFAALFLKSVSSEYGEIWSGALFISTVLWVLTTVLWNKTERAENWAKPGKQRGCHNLYRQGVLLLHRIMWTKPFLIALTLIHKLVSAILCCFNPFRSNYGEMRVSNILITISITVCYKGCVEPIQRKLGPWNLWGSSACSE